MPNFVWILYCVVLLVILFKTLDLPFDRWIGGWLDRRDMIHTYGKAEADKYRQWSRTHTSGVYQFPARRVDRK